MHKEDREILLKMILEVCSYYNESCNQIINDKDTESCFAYLFFISLLLQQQELINKICNDRNIDNEVKIRNDISLLDFMTWEYFKK